MYLFFNWSQILSASLPCNYKETGIENNSPSHVSGTGYYLVVINKPTAREIACVSRQFSAHSDVSFTCFQTVYGADVVETTTCYVAARGSIGTSHHPAGSQRYSMHLQISVFIYTLHTLQQPQPSGLLNSTTDSMFSFQLNQLYTVILQLCHFILGRIRLF